MKENNNIELEQNLNINQSFDTNKENEIIEISNKPNNKQNSKNNDIDEISKAKIKETIKNYINHTNNDSKYLNVIENDPQSLFSTIDEGKLTSWRKKLKLNCPLTYQADRNKDKDILAINLDNIRVKQTVINNDSKRTRVRECVLCPDFLDVLKKILIYYCDKYNIFYKQGLNEIFGPLILMRYKLKNISLTEIVNLSALIIDSFLPNYFYEKEIYSLRCGLGLFLTLFKYHEPTVFNKLDKMEINPEIYATNWLVTYISGKLSLVNFFLFWDEIIKINDPLFIQFLLIAVIKDKRELIINCEDNFLPTFLTSLTINNKEELDNLINIAKELRKQTPYSFRLLADKIGFLKKRNSDIKSNYEKYHPDSLPAMPIFPSEVLYITYKSQIHCINPNCKKYRHNFSVDLQKPRLFASKTIKVTSKNQRTISTVIPNIDSNVESQEICEKCDWGIEKTMQYILLDLRILEYGKEEESDTDKTGFLPSMISVPQDELKTDDFPDIMTNRFIQERGNYHFIFLTSDTDTFTDFESQYYKEFISEDMRKRMMFGLVEQHKVDKELDFSIAKKNLTLKQIFKLKEYDNMRKTLQNMIKHNFPYVGYVYGGFTQVHEESIKYEVELINHNEDTCLLCNPNIEEEKEKDDSLDDNLIEKSELYHNLWKHKKKLSYNSLEVFFENPNNKIHLCVLKEYHKKDINIGDVQILINLLFDKFEIEIYKFDKKRQYKDFENTFILKNRKKKEKYYDYGKKDELKKDLELTLLEKVFVLDMLSIKSDHKMKNVDICEIRGDKKKGGFLGFFKKNDEEEFETLKIVFDFSSDKEAKEFILSFKEMMDRYREFIKNKKK